jgi:hypothetical protein
MSVEYIYILRTRDLRHFPYDVFTFHHTDHSELERWANYASETVVFLIECTRPGIGEKLRDILLEKFPAEAAIVWAGRYLIAGDLSDIIRVIYDAVMPAAPPPVISPSSTHDCRPVISPADAQKIGHIFGRLL